MSRLEEINLLLLQKSTMNFMSARHLVRAARILVPLAALAPQAQASDALANRYACVACHQAEKKVVGPAWKDIAAKYKGTVTPEQLAASIKKGSSGKWGLIPMPPQGQVADADLASLAAGVLEGGPL